MSELNAHIARADGYLVPAGFRRVPMRCHL